MKVRQKIRIGLVDSGLSEPQEMQAVANRCFTGAGGESDPVDRLGHGAAICDIVTHYAPDILLYNAQVFEAQAVTTAAIVAAAIDWLRAEKVDLINLSLGLRHNRPVLEVACQRAQTAGIIMIASAPARGPMTWPAAYAGVIRATGDARCDDGEISFLESEQADFGGCPRAVEPPGNSPPLKGGASFGAAHISGQVAACLQAGGNKKTIREWLVSKAKYIHNEHRTE